MMSNNRTEDNFAVDRSTLRDGLALTTRQFADILLRRGAHILIADDERDFRKIMVRRATKMGLSVVEVEDGLQAIEVLERERFDLLMLDLHMPGKNGLEVIQATQEMDPDVPTIMITGGGTIEAASLCGTRGWRLEQRL